MSGWSIWSKGPKLNGTNDQRHRHPRERPCADARSFFRLEGIGQFPRWSRDGGTLYYWSEEDLLVDTLYAATVVTEPTFAVLSRDIVLTGNFRPENWDLHPDGDRIVAAQPSLLPQSDADGYFVVVNFFEELKARVPN